MSSNTSGGQRPQIPKSLQGLAKANTVTGLLVAYTAAFITFGVVDYAISKYNPTSRPVLSMHLNASNCQCPTCVSIRTGQYNQKARNVYSIPVGSDRQSLSRAAREMDRLAGDVSDWSSKGLPNSKPVIALEGDDRELKDQQARFASLASELNARSRDAPGAEGQKGLGSLGDVDRRESWYNA